MDVARANLSKLSIDGAPVEVTDLGNNVFQIFFQVENPDRSQLTVLLDGRVQTLSDVGLGIIDIEDESGSYAYHIPEGILLVFDPSNPVATDGGTISTTKIAPAMLANFNVQPPAYML